MKEELISLAEKNGFIKEVNNSRRGIFYHNDILEDETSYFLWLCLLQKYLIYKKNIDVSSYLIIKEFNGRQQTQFAHEKEYMYRIIKNGVDEYISWTSSFDKYEKALEFGLLKALKE